MLYVAESSFEVRTSFTGRLCCTVALTCLVIHLTPHHAGYVGGNARFCAQHRSDGMQLVRQVLTPEDPTPLALPDLASARTSTLTRPGFNTKAVVPQELSLGERVTGDSDTLRFLNPGPDIASVSPPPVAATTSTTPGSASLSVTTSVCVPGNVAVASLEGQTLQTLSVEEDPVPPTVPDPAELKRGTCEVRMHNWCLACFSSWAASMLQCFDVLTPPPPPPFPATKQNICQMEGYLLSCPVSPCL